MVKICTPLNLHDTNEPINPKFLLIKLARITFWKVDRLDLCSTSHYERILSMLKDFLFVETINFHGRLNGVEENTKIPSET